MRIVVTSSGDESINNRPETRKRLGNLDKKGWIRGRNIDFIKCVLAEIVVFNEHRDEWLETDMFRKRFYYYSATKVGHIRPIKNI